MPTPINAVSAASSLLAGLAAGRQPAHPLPDLSVVIPVTDAADVDALLAGNSRLRELAWVYIEKLYGLVPGGTRMNIFLTTRTVS
jgi:hypothetical protein